MKIILTFFLAIGLVGCATGGKDGQTKVYKSNYKLVKYKKLRAKSCPTNKDVEKLVDLDDLMSAANTCVKANAWPKVKDLGKKMLEKHSDAPWGAYYLALHAKTVGENQRALWMLDLGLKKSPNLSLFIYEKGRILWEMKDYQQSVSLIERAVDLDENLLEAQVFLGQVYVRDGFFKRANKHLKKAIQLDRENLAALKGLAETHLRLNKFEEAAKYLDDVVDEESTNLVAILKLAQVYEKNLQDYDEAISVYNKIKRKFPAAEVLKVAGINLDMKLKQLDKLVAQQDAAKRKISSVNKNKGAK